MENYIITQLTRENVGRPEVGYMSITQDVDINERGECILYTNKDNVKFKTIAGLVHTVSLQYNQVYTDIIFTLQQKQIRALQSNVDVLNNALNDNKNILQELKTIIVRQNRMLQETIANRTLNCNAIANRVEQLQIEH